MSITYRSGIVIIIALCLSTIKTSLIPCKHTCDFNKHTPSSSKSNLTLHYRALLMKNIVPTTTTKRQSSRAILEKIRVVEPVHSDSEFRAHTSRKKKFNWNPADAFFETNEVIRIDVSQFADYNLLDFFQADSDKDRVLKYDLKSIRDCIKRISMDCRPPFLATYAIQLGRLISASRPFSTGDRRWNTSDRWKAR